MMKNLILLLISFAFIGSASAIADDGTEPKVYLPLLGEHQTSFNIFTGYIDAASTDSLYYTGEREMEGKNYKVFMNDYNQEHLIRITEDNSKVYYLDPYLNEEVLTFDLSLEKGDDFIRHLPWGDPLEFTVDSVYTDDKGRKCLVLLSSDTDKLLCLKFIEGEGSSGGLFYCDGWTLLLCGRKDDVQTYFYYDEVRDLYEKYELPWGLELFGSTPSCNISYTGIGDASASDGWKVYSNPTQGSIFVQLEAEPIHQLFVYDEAGRLLLRKEVDNNEVFVELPFPAGTYYVLAITSNGKRYQQKIIRL